MIARLMLSIILMSGVATYYAGPYVGEPLYWDQRIGQIDGLPDDLIYLPSNGYAWVAVDETEYLSGRIQPGDWLWIYFLEDGYCLKARALDAGYLYRFHILDWPGERIVVDIPQHLWPLETMSARVRMVNQSAAGRMLEAASGGR